MLGRVPVLDCRPPGNLDWPDANYEADVTKATVDRSSGSVARKVVATNHLTGAAPLAALVASGDARWCLEVRSTQTFYVETFLAPERSNQVTARCPDDAVRVSTMKALPGLVAVRDCRLPIEGLHPAWQRRASIQVPRGTWLARAQHVDELQSGNSGIVRFDAEESVELNRMRIRYANDGLPFWIATINPADLRRYRDEPNESAKTAILAALVGALADAATQDEFADGAGEGDGTSSGGPTHVSGRRLAAKLKDLDPDCRLPGDQDFDPTYAASLLVGDELLVGESGPSDG